ncbi:MAG: hypothetical protein R3F30_09640 [Planctomycetota bacterium]
MDLHVQPLTQTPARIEPRRDPGDGRDEERGRAFEEALDGGAAEDHREPRGGRPGPGLAATDTVELHDAAPARSTPRPEAGDPRIGGSDGKGLKVDVLA